MSGVAAKCRYHGGRRAAATLMLDDFSPTATTVDGVVTPANDWGYGLDGEGSLYRYLQDTLLREYPEIRGTFFYPLGRHAAQNPGSGYRIPFRERDGEFRAFARRVSGTFEFAFHGVTHGRRDDPADPDFASWKQEFEYLGPSDLPWLRGELDRARETLGLPFTGGKYPGYRGGPAGDALVEALGFEWWAADASMLGRKAPGNRHGYLGPGGRVLAFPTNIDGGCFAPAPAGGGGAGRARRWRAVAGGALRRWRAEEHLGYLYESGLVISVQEHFQSLRTDGRRQTPNAFDDYPSLARIFGWLRGADVWHATCGDIARYLASYDRSELKPSGDGSFELTYRGSRERFVLSVSSPHGRLRDLDTGAVLAGYRKEGRWIFDRIPPGRYAPADAAAPGN